MIVFFVLIYLAVAIAWGKFFNSRSPDNPATAIVAIMWPGTMLLAALDYVITGRFP